MRNPPPTANPSAGRPKFKSFFLAGFECSTHRLKSGRRLDMLVATKHDQFALMDYARIQAEGLRTAREGVRWHLVEQRPGHYDFSSTKSIIQAAEVTGTQVIWDLCHFGWPDDIDIFKPEFVTRLARYGAAFARHLQLETGMEPWFVPVNEISFFSWAGGEEGGMNPHATGRGYELKCQLVRASVAAMNAIREVNPNARFVHVDPIIHVVAHPKRPYEREQAEAYRRSQFQSWDMLAGRLAPELGGSEEHLDIIGVNYYFHNQWIYDIKGHRRSHEFEPLSRTSPLYRPLREILLEVCERYHRPMFIAETGAEDTMRKSWFRYVVEEARAAIKLGVPLDGICLYPIMNYPGWLDGRLCQNGLWDYADKHGNRKIYQPLASELQRARKIFEEGAASPEKKAAVALPAGRKRGVASRINRLDVPAAGPSAG